MEVTVHGYVWERTGAHMTERVPDIHGSNPHRLDLFLVEVPLPYYLAVPRYRLQILNAAGPLLSLALYSHFSQGRRLDDQLGQSWSLKPAQVSSLRVRVVFRSPVLLT